MQDAGDARGLAAGCMVTHAWEPKMEIPGKWRILPPPKKSDKLLARASTWGVPDLMFCGRAKVTLGRANAARIEEIQLARSRSVFWVYINVC